MWEQHDQAYLPPSDHGIDGYRPLENDGPMWWPTQEEGYGYRIRLSQIHDLGVWPAMTPVEVPASRPCLGLLLAVPLGLLLWAILIGLIVWAVGR